MMTSLTVQEFLVQVPDDQRCELVHGEIVPLRTEKFRHETVKSNATRIFTEHCLDHPIGQVYSGTMYQLSDTDALQSDLSILLDEQIPPRPLTTCSHWRRLWSLKWCLQHPPSTWKTGSSSSWSEGRAPSWLPSQSSRSSVSSSPPATPAWFAAMRSWSSTCYPASPSPPPAFSKACRPFRAPAPRASPDSRSADRRGAGPAGVPPGGRPATRRVPRKPFRAKRRPAPCRPGPHE
jgi:putative restriction endonuclease